MVKFETNEDPERRPTPRGLMSTIMKPHTVPSTNPKAVKVIPCRWACSCCPSPRVLPVMITADCKPLSFSKTVYGVIS